MAVGLTALHLVLSWRVNSSIDRLIVSSLYWGAMFSLVWRKRDILNLESGVFSTFFGLFLVALVLIKSISLFWFESAFLRVFPLIAALGLGLLASGIQGLKQYWRELMVVLLLCLPEGLLVPLLENQFKITTLTAKFAEFVLWCMRFEVSRQGDYIILPQGATLVLTSCTGTIPAFLLLKLAVLFILMFSVARSKQILLLIGAVFIAFVTSGMRAALMAALVSNQEAFSYWHGGPGSQIFSTTAILCLGLLCCYVRQLDESTPNGKLRSP
jgi:cyanoexosortase A